jgi:glc operon protein GlcG
VATKHTLTTITLLALVLAAAAPSASQLADRKALTLEGAKRIMTAAEAEARTNNWNVAIAIVDQSGDLLMFQRLDEAPLANIEIALAKARTAVRLRQPTKRLEDNVAGGRTTLLAIEGAMPLEGGVPILFDGRVIGAVGVSGVASANDARIAQAGIDALVVR